MKRGERGEGKRREQDHGHPLLHRSQRKGFHFLFSMFCFCQLVFSTRLIISLRIEIKKSSILSLTFFCFLKMLCYSFGNCVFSNLFQNFFKHLKFQNVP